MYDLRTLNIAEWAIARLQIEGARQENLVIHQQKPVDLESKVIPQELGGIPMASLEATSKRPAGQGRSPEAVNGVNPEATSRRVPAHGSYKCINEKHSGRLIVTSLGVRFETAVGARNQWQIEYDNIYRVEKVRNHNAICHLRFHVFSLTVNSFSKDQSHCQNGQRSRYLIY